MSSRPTESSKSTSTNPHYRTNNLKPAKIFIDKLSIEQCPAHIVDICSTLSHKTLEFRSMATLDAVERTIREQNLSQEYLTALDRARHLPKIKIDEYAKKVENKWMEFNYQVLSGLLTDPSLDYTADSVWNVEVGPIAQGADLRKPKPDYGFGLAIQEETAMSDDQDMSVLTADKLRSLLEHSETRLFSCPIRLEDTPIFPFIIYEAKPDNVALHSAENQAAGCAAMALAMLYELFAAAGIEERLPVFAICSVGMRWNIWVAVDQYDRRGRPNYHLLQLEDMYIRRPADLFLLQLLLERLRQCAVSSYRPLIEKAVLSLLKRHKLIDSDASSSSLSDALTA